MNDLADTLGHLPAFRDFSPEELATLGCSLVISDYPDGYRFTVQGKRAPKLFIILDGQVDVTRRGLISNKERLLRTLERGDICGLQSLVDRLSEEATCVARGPVQAACFTRQVCDLLLAQSANIAFHFKLMVGNQLARDLAERNRTMRDQLAALSSSAPSLGE